VIERQKSGLRKFEKHSAIGDLPVRWAFGVDTAVAGCSIRHSHWSIQTTGHAPTTDCLFLSVVKLALKMSLQVVRVITVSRTSFVSLLGLCSSHVSFVRLIIVFVHLY